MQEYSRTEGYSVIIVGDFVFFKYSKKCQLHFSCSLFVYVVISHFRVLHMLIMHGLVFTYNLSGSIYYVLFSHKLLTYAANRVDPSLHRAAG